MKPKSEARILLVDDDRLATALLARMLREDGFTVDVANDGGTALERLAESPLPDALVTDIAMPRVDGLAVVRYARSLRPGMPVIVVTAYGECYPRCHDELRPAATLLAKPLDYGRLYDELQRITDGTVRGSDHGSP